MPNKKQNGAKIKSIMTEIPTALNCCYFFNLALIESFLSILFWRENSTFFTGTHHSLLGKLQYKIELLPSCTDLLWSVSFCNYPSNFSLVCILLQLGNLINYRIFCTAHRFNQRGIETGPNLTNLATSVLLFSCSTLHIWTPPSPPSSLVVHFCSASKVSLTKSVKL